MTYDEWALLVDDIYEAFGQKPPRAETVRRLWDRETQLVTSFPSSRLDDALQTLTRDDTRNRIAPRDILNTLRTLTKHRPRSADGARLLNYDGTYDAAGDFEWQLLRDAKTESARTGEPWQDVMDRLRDIRQGSPA